MNPVVEKVMGQALRIHSWIYPKSDGRIGARLAGRPMLILRTVGAKSGKPRTAVLLYAERDGSYAVVGSKGGSPNHPGWFHNLKANPAIEVQIGRRRFAAEARVAEGDERAALWTLANEVNQGQYDIYQSRTTRQIPVVVLTPR